MEVEQTEKKDVSELKKAIHEVALTIKLGIEIGKDGINKDDLQHVPAVIERVKAIIALAQELKELEAEGKDIDASEVGELLISIWSEIQSKE